MVYGETGRFDLEYYAKKRMINFWASIACGNKNKLSYIVYNICKQRYENEPQSSSEWFINIADMVHRYGLQGNIPNQEAIIKEVVKRMHINLKRSIKIVGRKRLMAQPNAVYFLNIFER